GSMKLLCRHGSREHAFDAFEGDANGHRHSLSRACAPRRWRRAGAERVPDTGPTTAPLPSGDSRGTHAMANPPLACMTGFPGEETIPVPAGSPLRAAGSTPGPHAPAPKKHRSSRHAGDHHRNHIFNVTYSA